MYILYYYIETIRRRGRCSGPQGVVCCRTVVDTEAPEGFLTRTHTRAHGKTCDDGPSPAHTHTHTRCTLHHGTRAHARTSSVARPFLYVFFFRGQNFDRERGKKPITESLNVYRQSHSGTGELLCSPLPDTLFLTRARICISVPKRNISSAAARAARRGNRTTQTRRAHGQKKKEKKRNGGGFYTYTTCILYYMRYEFNCV